MSIILSDHLGAEIQLRAYLDTNLGRYYYSLSIVGGSYYTLTIFPTVYNPIKDRSKMVKEVPYTEEGVGLLAEAVTNFIK